MVYAPILPKLKEHKRQQTEHRFKLGSHYENHNLVFANETGRPHHYRNLTQRHYEKILKKAELDKEGFVFTACDILARPCFYRRAKIQK